MADPVDESGLAPIKPIGSVHRVEVVGFNMPFLELVGFMIKFVLATIPAALILAVLGALVLGILGRSINV